MESTASPLGALVAQHLGSADFVRAVLSGAGDGAVWRKAVLRPVEMRGTRQLQVVTYDERRSRTRNVDDPASSIVAEVLAAPFRNAVVELEGATVQARVSKRGTVFQRTVRRAEPREPDLRHDHEKRRLIGEDAAFLEVLGLASGGAVKPSRQAKFRQINEFVRALDTALGTNELTPPVRVVDLGCGSAYLTFAVYHYFTQLRQVPCELLGVDRDPQAVRKSTERAASLGWDGMRFHTADIASLEPTDGDGVDVVMALHACDTASDDALAYAVAAKAGVVLVAPCCHHAIQVQLDAPSDRAEDEALLLRQPILRERFGDVLTDALRCALLRLAGYRADIVEFVDPEHSPKNLLIRATRHGGAPRPEDVADYVALRDKWHVVPSLERHLAPQLG